MTSPSDPYRLFDEVDPVADESWALHPSAPVVAMIMLPALVGVAVCLANSYLLRHPRRNRHAVIGAATALLLILVGLAFDAWLTPSAQRYASVFEDACRLYYAYNVASDQIVIAERFEEAGGKILGRTYTHLLIEFLSQVIPRRRR